MFILEGLESRDGSFLLLLPPHHYPALSSQQGLGRGLADQRGAGDACLADPPAGITAATRAPASLTQASGSRAPHASFRDPVALGNLVWPYVDSRPLFPSKRCCWSSPERLPFLPCGLPLIFLLSGHGSPLL